MSSSPGATLNRSVNTSMAATWLGAGLQVVLGLACRHEGQCHGRVFFVWLLIPLAIFLVLVLRARGISWRFSTLERMLPPSDQASSGSWEQRLTLPTGVLSTVLCGALAAEMLHGLGSSSPLATVCFLLVAASAAVAAAANCLILHTMPALDYSERQYSAVLALDEENKM